MEERDTTSVELEEQRVLLQVSGEDRVSFLHGMLSNDVSGLTPGGGAAALLLTEQGRINMVMARDGATEAPTPPH